MFTTHRQHLLNLFVVALAVSTTACDPNQAETFDESGDAAIDAATFIEESELSVEESYRVQAYGGSCVRVTQTINVPAGIRRENTVGCPAGTTIRSGGFNTNRSDSDFVVYDSYSQNSATWTLRAANNHSSDDDFFVEAVGICCPD